jgi:hypothetical protein
MPDTILTLGDFTFSRFEVPEAIAFGSGHRLSVHELVGGTRVVDAMGLTPIPLEWSGTLTGAEAVSRGRYIEGLVTAGRALPLSWSELRYTVVPRLFRGEFRRFYRVPYQIGLQVVSDDAAPVTTITPVTPAQAASDDVLAAYAMGAYGDAVLAQRMAAVVTALNAVGPLANAGPSAVAAVLPAIAAARARVGVLVAAGDAGLGGAVGGVDVGGMALARSGALLAQASMVANLPGLLALDRTLGRAAANLAALNGGQSTVTTGDDLYRVAAGQYGDAMAWTALAAANGVADPQAGGIATLVVPPLTNDTDGVLSA